MLRTVLHSKTSCLLPFLRKDLQYQFFGADIFAVAIFLNINRPDASIFVTRDWEVGTGCFTASWLKDFQLFMVNGFVVISQCNVG